MNFSSDSSINEREFSSNDPIFPNLSQAEELRVLMARIAQLQQNETMESSSASFDVLGQDGNVNNEETSFDDGGQQKYADNRTTPISVSAEQFNSILERIGELEKQQKNEEQQRGTSKTGTENVNAIVEKYDALFGRVAEIEKQQQQKVTALEEHLEKLDNFIGILKDRFGNELLNAVHPKIRQNIAEKFSTPHQNCLDVNACHCDLEIFGPNCLIINYKSDGSGFRSVFAKHSIPCSESAGIFYFEMKIINVKNLCSIGFATKAMPLDERISQNSDSCAYQSDGQFWANGSNSIGNANFSRGDFVGCGINLATRRIIFTKNGRPLDTSDLFLSTPFDFPLFPFISLNDSGDLIETNFGPQFKFDPAKVILNFPRQNYWDANVCDENLQIIGNKSLTVHHKGTTSGWCSVFAEHPILLNNNFSDIFYYEISAINKKVRLIFGFAVKQQNKWYAYQTIHDEKGTYAYESDGDIWINAKGKGTNHEYSYGVGDTVGIGVNLITRQLFFTKNGKHFDSSDFFVAPYLADVSFHPFVSLHDDGDQIEANFGPNFKFDFGNSKISGDHLKAILERIGEMEKQQQQQTKAAEERFLQSQNDQKNILEKVSELEKQTKKMVNEWKRKVFLKFQENCWDAFACHKDIEISGDKSLIVQHKGNDHDSFRSVFAKYPIVLNKHLSDFFYYEISVMKEKEIGWGIFGFAVKQQTKLDELIRYEKGTYAYECDGQIRINGKGKGTNAEYSYDVGDTVGIGVNSATRQLFFTKNGLRLNTSDLVDPSCADGSLYPFVTLFYSGEKIEANFGPNFKFDLATL